MSHAWPWKIFHGHLTAAGKKSVGETRKTTWFNRKSIPLDENLTWEKILSLTIISILLRIFSHVRYSTNKGSVWFCRIESVPNRSWSVEVTPICILHTTFPLSTRTPLFSPEYCMSAFLRRRCYTWGNLILSLIWHFEFQVSIDFFVLKLESTIKFQLTFRW